MRLDHDMAETFAKEALDIFTSVVNAGRRFDQALTAIYLSGLVAGMHAERERGK